MGETGQESVWELTLLNIQLFWTFKTTLKYKALKENNILSWGNTPLCPVNHLPTCIITRIARDNDRGLWLLNRK